MSTQMKMKPNAHVMKTSNDSKVSNDSQLMTSTQSLSVVKTLIQTGIGVITYLRGVFPEECFNDDKIGPDRSQIITDGTGTSEGKKNSQREGRGYIRVKNLKRGASKESDRILDYLDEGVMDAIQRGFLRKLLFAMYLDPDKPRDVIECYSFNFTYRKSKANQGEMIPELEVRDQLRKLSIGGKVSILARNDSQNSPKTCGMVKRQVQALIKNLICSTQSLSDINSRRFLTFKLDYNDHTPEDYEPPHFVAGDPDQDRYTFGTSGIEEVPSATEMGKVDTGFHSVRVALATISGYLPEPNSSDPKISTHGPRTAVELRELELKKVREEAREREIVWDTEKILAPSPPLTPTGLKKVALSDNVPSSKIEPIGRRDPAGRIIPLVAEDASLLEKDDDHVNILKRKAIPDNNLKPENDPTLISTQTEVQSQLTPTVPASNVKQSNCSREKLDYLTQVETQIEHDTSEERPVLGSCVENHNTTRKSENNRDSSEEPIEEASFPTQDSCSQLSMGNKNKNPPASYDPIESVSSSGANKLNAKGATNFNPALHPESTQSETSVQGTNLELLLLDSNKKPKRSKGGWPGSCNKSDICECRDEHDDQDMIACEICRRWRHLTCYGYHSEKDPRIPDFFVCYRCRIHKGMDLTDVWSREADIRISLEALRGLCIFRRTLQIIYQEGLPSVLKSLALRLEVDLPTASQIKHRLEIENYICPKPSAHPSTSGILESERRNSNRRKKSKKLIKSMIVNQSYEQKKLRDQKYFSPGSGAEAKILQKFYGELNQNDDGYEIVVNANQVDDPRAVSRPSPGLSSNRSPQSVKGNEYENRVSPRNESHNPELQDDIHQRGHHDPTEANAQDITMQDGSRWGQSDGFDRNSVLGKNKVSIGVEELEVVGVTWADCDE